MKFKKIEEKIVQDLRGTVNQNILIDIANGSNKIPPDQIFNFYTGNGGLHGLKFQDFSSYHTFSEKKKEMELGQFFTGFDAAKHLMDILSPNGTVMDPCCGHGVFCNFVDRENDFYGCEIDANNTNVAKHLFPSAHIEACDALYWEPKEKADYIVTNPPFNLKWYKDGDYISSQSYILRQAKHWLKDYGVFAAIVPQWYLEDEMYHKQDIGYINTNYNWLGQIRLEKTAFINYGIDIDVKMIFFQNHPVDPNFSFDYQDETEILFRVAGAKEEKKKHSLASIQSNLQYDGFAYKAKKLLYEIKRQKETKKNLEAALELIDKLHTQKKPLGMEYPEWEKRKLKPGTVLYHLRQYSCTQQKKKRTTRPPKPADPIATTPFFDIAADPIIQTYLDGFSFQNEYGTHYLDAIQKNDLNKIIQKKYAILNWEQGVGKTVGGYCAAKYRGKKTFVVAPSLAINKTWVPFLTHNQEAFQIIKKEGDLKSDAPFFLVSFSVLARTNGLQKPSNDTPKKASCCWMNPTKSQTMVPPFPATPA